MISVNALELKKVSFAYSNQMVFDKLEFKVPAGDFVALVGPNGAGKSTLLRLSVGLLRPVAGSVEVFGRPLTNNVIGNQVGYVPQHPLDARSFPVTVEEVVAMGRVAGLGFGKRFNAADRKMIDEVLQITDTQAIRHRLIGQLSGGQQQRVLIARALVSQPKILILDEPTSGVDTAAKEGIYSLLRMLNQEQQVTIIIVSHDVECISRYASRIASINHGLQCYDTAEQFSRKYQTAGVAWPNGLELGEVLRA